MWCRQDSSGLAERDRSHAGDDEHGADEAPGRHPLPEHRRGEHDREEHARLAHRRHDRRGREPVRGGYPDPAQFNSASEYYDAKSDPGNPRWYCVDVRLVEKYPQVVATKTLKADPVGGKLEIFRHTRLSIAPATAEQWEAVQRLGGSRKR